MSSLYEQLIINSGAKTPKKLDLTKPFVYNSKWEFIINTSAYEDVVKNDIIKELNSGNCEKIFNDIDIDHLPMIDYMYRRDNDLHQLTMFDVDTRIAVTFSYFMNDFGDCYGRSAILGTTFKISSDV